MTTFTNFKTPDKDTLLFDVSNCNSSFVNSIRRTIITEVETISFNTEDYMNSDIKIIKNTSSLHNQFILQRIGLIPIFSKNMSEYNPDKYKFTINKSNNTPNIIDITTDDIEILNLETNNPEQNDDFFPRNSITNDKILITKLKPNPNKEGQALHLEGKSSKGIGSMHIRFSPVSNVLFINKQNDKLVNIEFNKYIDTLQQTNNKQFTKEELATLGRKFKIEKAERFFYTDANNNPNVFEFTIESCGIMKPQDILLEALNKLNTNIKNIVVELNKELSNKPSSIKIKESECLMKSYDITLDGLTHTIGHILQSYINIYYKHDNLFVGYMNPHPLQKKIIIRIAAKDINHLKEIIISTCNKLSEELNNLITSTQSQTSVSKEIQPPPSKPSKKKILFKPKPKLNPKNDPELLPN